MKKFLLFIGIAAILLYVSDLAYKSYRLHYLTDDRAVLYVYINLKADEVGEYFNLTGSESEKIQDGYSLRCVLPGYEYLHLINNKVNFDISAINCAETYDFDRQLELRRAYVKDYTLRIELLDKDSRKVAYKDVSLQWDYGKVNHVIIEKDKQYKYCSN